MKSYCTATNNLPNIPAALNVTDSFDFYGTNFTVNSPLKPSSDPNYFYSINITISPPSPSSIASLHATVGYRFLQGDISLMLEVPFTYPPPLSPRIFSSLHFFLSSPCSPLFSHFVCFRREEREQNAFLQHLLLLPQKVAFMEIILQMKIPCTDISKQETIFFTFTNQLRKTLPLPAYVK